MLIGSADDSLAVTPWHHQAEVWASSFPLHNKLPRWDRWIEIHGVDEDGMLSGYSDYAPWLQQTEGMVYVKNKADLQWVPRAMLYPKDKVLAALPASFLTSSIAWMMALAIYLHPDEIGLYGVNAAGPDEYSQQHPSICWLIGLAQGRGIRVTIPPESDVLKAGFLYGYERSAALARKFKSRHKDALEVVGTHKQVVAEALKQQHQHEGRAMEIEYLLRNWA